MFPRSYIKYIVAVTSGLCIIIVLFKMIFGATVPQQTHTQRPNDFFFFFFA